MRDIGGGGGGRSAPRARPNPNYRGDDRARRDGRSGGQRARGGDERARKDGREPGGGGDRGAPNPLSWLASRLGGLTQEGAGGAVNGARMFGRGAADLSDQVGRAAAEVQEFARQRALDLALEANGLVGTGAQAMAQDAHGAMLESVQRAQANPITEGPLRRLAALREQMGGAMPQQPAFRPLPNARPGGAPMTPLAPAPLGGPSVVRPLRTSGLAY